MRILLIKGPREYIFSSRMPVSLDWGIYPPLGLAYIASILEKNGYEVKIVDFEVGKENWKKIEKRILQEQADIVGITSTTPTFQEDLKIAKIAKESGSIVVLGGPQISAYPKESISFDYVDYGVIGDGEYVMLELVKSLEKGIQPKYMTGLVSKKKNSVIVNSPAVVKELDTLPFPARHLLPINLYRLPLSQSRFTTMLTSRGCPYRCGFCFKQSSDKFFRVRSPRNIVEEIEECIKKYKIKEIVFYDDSFGLIKKHTIELCKEIIKRNLDIKWEARMRIDSVNVNVLKWMKRAGCKRLRYGIESGNQKILKLIQKGITLRKVKDVVKQTKKAGIQTFGYFIIGYIYETPQTMMETIKFSTKLDLDWAIFTIAVPLPNTQLFHLAKMEGLIKGDPWRNYILGKKSIPLPYLAPNAEKWLNTAYKKFYFRPNILLKKLKELRSFKMLKYYVDVIKGIVFFQIGKRK